MRIFLVLLFLTLPFSTAQAITFAEGIEKCRSMSVSERKDSQLCQKVIAKIKEYKAAGKPIPGYPKPVVTTATVPPVADKNLAPTTTVKPKPVAPKKDLSEEYNKQVKIKEKCQKLAPPNQYKYKACHQYMNLANDPFLGTEKPTSAQYSLSLGYSLLGDVKGLDFEVERRTKYFGVGLFFSQQTVTDTTDTQIKGSAYGVSVHYHFTPLYYTQQGKMDVAAFGQLGLASYQSETQGQLPSYLYANAGLSASMPLFKLGPSTVRGFMKAGVVHIYHSESAFLGLGGSGTLGLKFDF
jgi:hypothetical protein